MSSGEPWQLWGYVTAAVRRFSGTQRPVLSAECHRPSSFRANRCADQYTHACKQMGLTYKQMWNVNVQTSHLRNLDFLETRISELQDVKGFSTIKHDVWVRQRLGPRGYWRRCVEDWSVRIHSWKRNCWCRTLRAVWSPWQRLFSGWEVSCGCRVDAETKQTLLLYLIAKGGHVH